MELAKSRTAYRPLTTAKRLMLEALFFGVFVPLAIVYAAAGSVWGIVTVAARPFGASPQFAYGPWKDIGSILALLWKHVRFIYRLEFLPWRKKRLEEKRVRAMEQLAALRYESSRRAQVRALISSSDCDSVDAEMFWLLVIQFLPYAIFIPQLVVSTIGFISVWSFMPHYSGVVVYAPAVPAPTVVYEPQPADVQEADFGPWLNRGQVIDIVKAPTYRKIAFLSDTGSAKYSVRKTGRLDGFSAARTEKITSVRLINGQIAFEDERHNRFAVNPGQVFLLSGDTASAYVFTSDAQLQIIDYKKLQTEEN